MRTAAGSPETAADRIGLDGIGRFGSVWAGSSRIISSAPRYEMQFIRPQFPGAIGDLMPCNFLQSPLQFAVAVSGLL